MIAKCVMEKFVENTLLYDFYGELLTDHQRRIYESVVFEDLSLAEAAETEKISRQAVHDIIRRCNAALNEYESKLHFMERFRSVRAGVEQIQKAAESRVMDRKLILRITQKILEEI